MSPWLRFDECSKIVIVQPWRHHVLLIGVVVLFARRLETESPKYPRCRFFLCLALSGRLLAASQI